MPNARLAVDIGGTFTDLALEHAGKRTTAKVLTTPSQPERGVIEGVRSILATSRVAPVSSISETRRRMELLPMSIAPYRGRGIYL